ncbi:MAG: hypothetical protein ACUVRD_02575 [Bacteroidia bacterium]
MRWMWWGGVVGYYVWVLGGIYAVEVYAGYVWSDGPYYLAAAQNFLHLGQFVLPQLGEYIFEWPMGYPLGVVFLSRVTGLGVFYASKVGAAISVLLSVGLLYLLGGKNRPWIFFAGWAPFYAAYLFSPHAEHLYIPLFLFLAWQTRRYVVTGKGWFFLALGGLMAFWVRYIGLAWVLAWGILGIIYPSRRWGLWLGAWVVGMVAVVSAYKGLFTLQAKSDMSWATFWAQSRLFPRTAVVWGAIALWAILRRRGKVGSWGWLWGIIALTHVGILLAAIGRGRGVGLDLRLSMPFFIPVLAWVGKVLPWKLSARLFLFLWIFSWGFAAYQKQKHTYEPYETYQKHVQEAYEKLDSGAVVVGLLPPALLVARYDLRYIDVEVHPVKSFPISKAVYVEWSQIVQKKILFFASPPACHSLGPCLERWMEGKLEGR